MLQNGKHKQILMEKIGLLKYKPHTVLSVYRIRTNRMQNLRVNPLSPTN